MTPTARSSTSQESGIESVQITDSNQATHTTLTTADEPGTAYNYSTAQIVSTVVPGTPVVFTLGSAGLAEVRTATQASQCSGTSGITCYSVIGYSPLNNSAINKAGVCPPGGGAFETVTWATSETAGTASDPTLNLTYSVLQKFVFWQYQDY